MVCRTPLELPWFYRVRDLEGVATIVFTFQQQIDGFKALTAALRTHYF